MSLSSSQQLLLPLSGDGGRKGEKIGNVARLPWRVAGWADSGGWGGGEKKRRNKKKKKEKKKK